MPASTRSSNRKTDYKVYYGKKPLKQRYFPARRTIVRPKPSKAPASATEPWQMVFTDAIRKRNSDVVQDSDTEDENEEGRDEQEEQDEQEQYKQEEPVRPPVRKRRRTTAADSENTRTVDVAIKAEPPSQELGIADSESEESGEEPLSARRARLRRQSTMTQFAKGTRPPPGSHIPDFVPVRRQRRSFGRLGVKDKGQRTLTQMVPGMVVGDTFSDWDEEEEEEEEEDEEDEEDEGRAIDTVEGDTLEHGRNIQADGVNEGNVASAAVLADPRVLRGVRTRQTNRKGPLAQDSKENDRPEISDNPGLPNSSNAIRSILSTPRSRRMREIPSSQSPTESSLSTQTTPHINRSPLKERSRNANALLDTPSKKKQVTFQEPAKPPIPALRKFESIIPDSDEEEEEWSQDDEPTLRGEDIGVETQAIIRHIDQSNLGKETQALIQQIDHACANSEEDAALLGRIPSEELGELRLPANSLHQTIVGNEKTPADPLVEVQPDPGDGREATPSPVETPHARCSLTPQALRAGSGRRRHPPRRSPRIKQELESQEQMSATFLHKLSRNTQLPPSALGQQHDSTDLDGHPITVSQIPVPAPGPSNLRSPNPDTQYQAHSHSNDAETFPQNQYLTYTQYNHARVPPSSSMHMAVSDTYSYQQTPNMSPTQHQFPPSTPVHLSQATTVDYEVSPRKTQTPRKTETPCKPKSLRKEVASPTPTRPSTTRCLESSPPIVEVPSSQEQLFVSPAKMPPPLVIPSSVPASPMMMRQWRAGDFSSSPILGALGSDVFRDSLGEFSIPPLPPGYGEREEGE